MPIKRFCIWATLTFLTVFTLDMSVPMTWWSVAISGGAVGIAWEIALRYLEEPDDWN
jgi:hypothetical protein